MANPTKAQLITEYQALADSVTKSTIELTDAEAAAILSLVTDYNTNATVFPNVKPTPSIKFRT